jgi:cytochrome c peroxidase
MLGALCLILLSCAPREPPDEQLAADEVGLSRIELLGKRLFEDASLSEPAGQSCASCHEAEKAFTGNAGSPVEAVAAGARPSTLGNRNAPTLLYALFTPPLSVRLEYAEVSEGFVVAPFGGLFWDGRADTLEDQAKGPFLNEREMANPDEAAVVRKVMQSQEASLFLEVFGPETLADPEAAYDAVAAAIAAYERTARFSPFSSRFDDWLRGDGTLTEEELRGLALFLDPNEGNCVACHSATTDSRAPSDWLFTNFGYEALGTPRNDTIPDFADPAFFDLGFCAQPTSIAKLPETTPAEGFCGSFRVPTLRNVARTSPYMHNGVFSSLRDVVRFYATRDTSPERHYPGLPNGSVAKFDDTPPEYRGNINTVEAPYDRDAGEEPRLDDGEIDAIVAFLETLSDR